jgi:hypothetical protein
MRIGYDVHVRVALLVVAYVGLAKPAFASPNTRPLPPQLQRIHLQLRDLAQAERRALKEETAMWQSMMKLYQVAAEVDEQRAQQPAYWDCTPHYDEDAQDLYRRRAALKRHRAGIAAAMIEALRETNSAKRSRTTAALRRDDATQAAEIEKLDRKIELHEKHPRPWISARLRSQRTRAVTIGTNHTA